PGVLGRIRNLWNIDVVGGPVSREAPSLCQVLEAKGFVGLYGLLFPFLLPAHVVGWLPVQISTAGPKYPGHLQRGPIGNPALRVRALPLAQGYAQQRPALEGIPPNAPQRGAYRQLRSLLFQSDGYVGVQLSGQSLSGIGGRVQSPSNYLDYPGHHLFVHLPAQQYQDPRLARVYHTKAGIAYPAPCQGHPCPQLFRSPPLRYVVRYL